MMEDLSTTCKVLDLIPSFIYSYTNPQFLGVGGSHENHLSTLSSQNPHDTKNEDETTGLAMSRLPRVCGFPFLLCNLVIFRHPWGLCGGLDSHI